MSATIQPNFDEYKQIAADFFRALKTTNDQDKIDAGLKCLGIAYLGMTGTENEKYQALIVYQLAHKEVNKKELEVILATALGRKTQS